MGYTPSFTPQYENGWEDLPSETSPITAEALNAYDEAIENIEEYLASDESQANLADAYDETATYEAGDYIIYGGDLYKCLEDIDTPEEWDSTHWTPVNVTDEMGHGGGGSNVTITPTLSTGTKIADFEIDGQTGELYAPTGGGGNANIWTGTQAELEEVFDELEEGTQINITDDEQEVVEGGTIYSEEEQVIGLWTDNRPLYQRTYVYENTTTLTSNTNMFALDDAVEVKYIEGYIKSPERVYPLPYANGSKSTDVITMPTNGVNYLTLVIVGDSWSSSYSPIVTTIKYTKTIDAPLDAVVGKSTMYIASSDCYSTVEKEVGCWTDGKPLYQRSFYVSALPSSAGSMQVATGLTGIEMCKITGGWSNGFGELNIVRCESTNAVTYGVGCRVSVSSGVPTINIEVGRDRHTIDAWVTIQYTKTTDTAGSGQYTPASGKAIHYSTDEQVIGTWIDGKPIYRRTLTGLSVALNGTNWVNYNPSIPIDKIVDLHAYYVTTSDTLLSCAIAEYQYTPTTGIQLTAVQSYNRTVNILTIEYTKTTD